MFFPQGGQSESNQVEGSVNRVPGALGPEHVDYVFNHTGDYLFIIHIQGGASTSFLATVEVELEGEELIHQRLIMLLSLHHQKLAIPTIVLSARSERVPFGDRLPAAGFLWLHVRGVHHHGPRVARPLLPPLARPASDSILDRRSDISRHVGEGHVPGKST